MNNQPPIGPGTIEIDLTDACNHDCVWCSDIFIREKKGLMPEEVVNAALIQAKMMGVKSVVFKGGGEPSIYKHFESAVRTAKNEHLRVGLITNGSRLVEHHDVIDDCMDWVRVSLDAGTEAIHTELHVTKGDFNHIIEGMQGLSKPIVILNYVISQDNNHEVEIAKKLCRDNGWKFSSIDVQPSGAAITDYDSMKIESTDKPAYIQCYAADNVIVVAADGKVYACCYGKGVEDMCLGDLTIESLVDIYERRLKYRDAHCSKLCVGQTSARRYDVFNDENHPPVSYYTPGFI